MEEGRGRLSLIKEGSSGVRVIEERVLSEWQDSQVRPVHEHGSTAPLRVHTHIRTMEVVQHAFLKVMPGHISQCQDTPTPHCQDTPLTARTHSSLPGHTPHCQDTLTLMSSSSSK